MKSYARAIVKLTAIVGIGLIASEVLAAPTVADGTVGKAALDRAVAHVTGIVSTASYAIAAGGACAAAYFWGAKQNLGAGLVSGAAAIGGVVIPQIIAVAAVI